MKELYMCNYFNKLNYRNQQCLPMIGNGNRPVVLRPNGKNIDHVILPCLSVSPYINYHNYLLIFPLIDIKMN